MLRFGILGFGAHGDRRLMPGFARARQAWVSALSRRSIEKARATAAQYGIPHAFDSKEALCRCPEVDAVLVSTPNAEHCEDVLLALRCGKPVLCEKPMAMNTAEAEAMARAAAEAGLLLGVAQIFRFEESTRRLRERLAADEIGAPVFARAEFSYNGLSHPRRWLLNRALSGGGPVADVGVHCLDALRFILNDEVRTITALARTDANSGEVEAAAVLALAFARGTLATVLVSLRADYRTPLEFVGTRGVLRADDGLTVDHPIRIERWKSGQLDETETVDNSLAYARQVDAFAAALAGGPAFPVPAAEGVRNQRLLDAAYASIASGESVTLEP